MTAYPSRARTLAAADSPAGRRERSDARLPSALDTAGGERPCIGRERWE